MPLFSRRFAADTRLQAAANNSPPLAYGTTGPAVGKMQSALVQLGFPMPITTAAGTKPADSIWGSETAATVRQFQSQQGLAADGVAGHDTLGRLDALMRAREDAARLRDFVAARNCRASTARTQTA